MPAIPAIITAGASIVGGLVSSHMNTDAANTQANAANTATAAKAASDAAALAFQRQQAQAAWQSSEATRKANYDQWAAQQQHYNVVRAALGLPANSIPAYVPSQDPNLSPAPATTTTTTSATGDPTVSAPPPTAPTSPSSAAGPTIDAAKGDIASQIAAYYKARGVTPNPTSVDYWTQKWTEFGAKDPAYFNTRLSQAEEFGSGTPTTNPATATATAPKATPAYVGFQSAPTPTLSIGGYLNAQNQTQPPLWGQPQPAVRPPVMGSFGSYL